MEDGEKTLLEQMLLCTVCRDVFKDPRQLPCGHSICMACLESLLNHSSESPLRCPDCRSYFEPIIRIQKCYTLANITENFREIKRKMEEQTKTVHCDFCPGKETLAIKTCLKCEVSMCEEHVKDHQELPVFMGHPLVWSLGDLQERKCPQHEDAVLRYYCNMSRRYICNMCALERKQHNLANESSTVLRRQLTDYMDQHLTVLQNQIKESTDSVRKLREGIEHEKQKVNPGHSSLNSVTVMLLCLWFIALYYAYNYAVENQTLSEALDRQQNRVHHIYSTIAELLTEHLTGSHILPEQEDTGMLTFAVNTASPFLGVAADLQTVERVKVKLDYPKSISRFDEAPQVLSTRCFSSGTHTWEVKAEGYWDIAVSYKSIPRKNRYTSAFGNNPVSWSLTHNSEGKLSAYHNGEKIELTGSLPSSQIEVRVDFEMGDITFSAVEATVTLLHMFKVKLTQPACLGVGLYHVDPPSRVSIVKAS
ncbi:E3 ubiquitin/ISG15 ligase TRIM25-like [Echeneis naucrates]|uniref:E3 ubiquitin/ISG15 ligase TRIM25-like n=1 Tax=Echeneis naucrates TaxID=173247 RepID=A0A665X9K8_ECHNA|nr:E3 ubiquitin/ISG15 ligase TRIM25-like [Echeneis naucrates]